MPPNCSGEPVISLLERAEFHRSPYRWRQMVHPHCRNNFAFYRNHAQTRSIHEEYGHPCSQRPGRLPGQEPEVGFVEVKSLFTFYPREHRSPVRSYGL